MKGLILSLGLTLLSLSVVASPEDSKNAEAKFKHYMTSETLGVRVTPFTNNGAIFDYANTKIFKKVKEQKKVLIDLFARIHVYPKHKDQSVVRFYFVVDECFDTKTRRYPHDVRINDKSIEHSWRCVPFKNGKAMELAPKEATERDYILSKFNNDQLVYLETHFGIVSLSTKGFKESWKKYTDSHD